MRPSQHRIGMRSSASGKRYGSRTVTARLLPSLAHLPSFGLITPNWDYQDPDLLVRAAFILRSEGIAFREVTEAAQALFWYEDVMGNQRLHDWTDQK